MNQKVIGVVVLMVLCAILESITAWIITGLVLGIVLTIRQQVTAGSLAARERHLQELDLDLASRSILQPTDPMWRNLVIGLTIGLLFWKIDDAVDALLRWVARLVAP